MTAMMGYSLFTMYLSLAGMIAFVNQQETPKKSYAVTKRIK